MVFPMDVDFALQHIRDDEKATYLAHEVRRHHHVNTAGSPCTICSLPCVDAAWTSIARLVALRIMHHHVDSPTLQ
jgi:hypothetical protein